MRHIYLTLALLLFTSELLAQTRGASRVVGKEDVLSGFYDKTWAVIIGIDDYPSLSYNLQLQQAVKDAEGVKKALEDSYRFDKIITLYNAEATRDGIVEVLLGQLRKAGENDGVFVFFAGHGKTVSTEDGDLGYLLPHDGSFDEGKLYKNISMTTLKNDVAKAVPAKHIFFVMDACYSGLLLAQRGPGDGEPAAERLDYLREVTKERARQVLSAGGKGQTVLDGGRNGHSVFTGRLLQALEEADGYITAKEIGSSLPEKVFYDAQDRDHKQQPQFGRLAGQGDFVFVKKTQGKPKGSAEIPEWYLSPPQDPSRLYANMTMVGQDEQKTLDTTLALVGRELTQMITYQLHAIRRQFQQETGTSQNSGFIKQFNTAIMVVSDQVVLLSEVDQRQVVADTNGYRSFVLMSLPVAAIYQQLLERIRVSEDLHARFRETRLYEEMQEEIRRYEKR